jgi:hypothetical protein
VAREIAAKHTHTHTHGLVDPLSLSHSLSLSIHAASTARVGPVVPQQLTAALQSVN